MSPHTVTGHFTGWTFHSSTRIALAWSQSAFTSASDRGLHSMRCSICRSRSAWDGIVSVGQIRDPKFLTDRWCSVRTSPTGIAGEEDRRILAKRRVPMRSEEGKTNRFVGDGLWLFSLALLIISFRSALCVCFCPFLFFFVSLRFLFSILCVQNRKTISNQWRPKKENCKKQKITLF